MAQVYFIDVTYFQQNTTINDQVESNMITPALRVAQDKHAENYLGTRLFNKLKQDIEDDSLTGIYQTILVDYLKIAMVYWTLVELYPSLLVKHDNTTLTIRSGEGFSPISEDQYKMLVDAARNNAQMYTERLIRYLCDNSGIIPEYTSCQAPDVFPKRTVYSENNMVFSGGNTAMSNSLLRAGTAVDRDRLTYLYWR